MLLSLLSFPGYLSHVLSHCKTMIRFSTTWFSFTNLSVCVLFSSSALASGASELLDFTGAFRLLSLVRFCVKKGAFLFFWFVGVARLALPHVVAVCASLPFWGKRGATPTHKQKHTHTHKTPTAQRPLSALALPFLNRCAWRFRAFCTSAVLNSKGIALVFTVLPPYIC